MLFALMNEIACDPMVVYLVCALSLKFDVGMVCQLVLLFVVSLAYKPFVSIFFDVLMGMVLVVVIVSTMSIPLISSAKQS